MGLAETGVSAFQSLQQKLCSPIDFDNPTLHIETLQMGRMCENKVGT